MFQSSLDILQVFVVPPGNLLYFLIVVGLSQAGLFMVYGQTIPTEAAPFARRYVIALGGVLIAWIVMLFGGAYTLFSDQNPAVILPPLERAVVSVSVLLIGWAFLSIGPQRGRTFSNVIIVMLLGITLVGYAATALLWPEAALANFNLSAFGVLWSLWSAALAFLGMVLSLVLFGQVVDAPLKFIYFAVLLVGFVLTLYQSLTGQIIGNDPGALRVAFALSLVLVPIVVYRMMMVLLQQIPPQDALNPRPIGVQSPAGRQMLRLAPEASPDPNAGTLNVPSAMPETPIFPGLAVQDAHNTDEDKPEASSLASQPVQLLKALGMMLESPDPVVIPSQIIATVLAMLRADVGALLRLQDANYADVVVAKDRLMQREPAAIALNLEDQPTLVNAIERRSQRPLFPDRNADELDDLYTRLDVEQAGPAYFQPLVRDDEVIGVILVAFPYTDRELTQSELELLKGLGIIAGSLLSLSYESSEAVELAQERAIQAVVEGVTPNELSTTEMVAAREEMQQNLIVSRAQINQLSKQIMQLKLQRDDERTRLIRMLGDTGSNLSVTQRLISVTEEQDRLRQERDQLARRLQEAEAAFNGVTADSNAAVISGTIEALQKEKSALEKERDHLQAELELLRTQSTDLVPEELQQMLGRMINERGRLESERDQLKDKLGTIDIQLANLGIEDGINGLSDLISHLYDERTSLLERLEYAQQERDTLLTERRQLADRIAQEKSREERLKAMQQDLQQIAGDREAAIKQVRKLQKEREDLLETVNRVKENRARAVAEAAGLELALEEAYDEQAQLRAQIQELADERSSLIDQRDRLNAQIQMLQAQTMSQEGQAVPEAIEMLRGQIDDLSDERLLLEQQVNDLQLQLANAHVQLDRAMHHKPTDSTVSYAPQEPELLVGMVQELRTPMTSIAGYVELLISESSGILGEMQRKFLRRVSANVLRLQTMIDDLVHLTELDTGNYRLEPRPVDIIQVIEDAITNAANQFREKGLAVTMQLEEDLPAVAADIDAIKQIVGQLLTNAYLVSPVDTEITLCARQTTFTPANAGFYEDDDRQLPLDVEAVLVSVEDRGGGILPEDVPRVFGRKYKAENPLIDGLGDTGVGMSIARALVEAHGGQLWVESEAGVGSTFNFVIPLRPISETMQG